MYDGVIIGAGVIGVAFARALALKNNLKIALIEKEGGVAYHTSGRNSGVVHAGFHLKPGSLKARLCVEGSRRIAQYCRERGIPYQQVGKLIVATDEADCQRLPELEHRAHANGLEEVRIVDERELREIEPYARGLAGFYSPYDGILDARQFVQALAQDALHAGVELKLEHRVIDVHEERDHVRLQTNKGEIRAKWVINCAGVYADRIAHLFGVGREYKIVPFRGEYYKLIPEKRHLIRGLIYPMPDPELPFLGVHFTKTVDGEVLIGPNAVLALGRESYTSLQINLGETLSTLSSLNFLRLIGSSSFWKVAFKELRTSLSKRAFVREAQKLVPAIEPGDFTKGRAGIRAQLVDRRGRLVEDFVLARTDRSVHILNAVSPGLTCSLAFADYVSEQLAEEGFWDVSINQAQRRVSHAAEGGPSCLQE